MNNTLKFEEIAGRLIGAPGIHAIRWRDHEAAHVVTIDWTGTTPEEKQTIKAAADKIVKANPTHLFVITMAGE